MSLNDGSRRAPQRRRRGAALEDALLEAAWAELLETGFDDMTYDAVAERAQTSRAVLYRRWPSKRDLALAAVARAMVANPITTPDTGSLRGDMIALLRAANDNWTRLGVQLVARLSSSGDGTLTVADLREGIAHRSDARVGALLERAHARGEIPTTDLPPRVRNVAFDLLRHDVIVAQQAVSAEEIAQIVDEVFLPLVRCRT